ncbi:MAG: transglycosylase SLT domain-containing protein [Gammaproteobacteria bacterium]
MKPVAIIATACVFALAFASQAQAGPVSQTTAALTDKVKAAMKVSDDGFRDVYVRQVWMKIMGQRLAPIVPDSTRRHKLLLLVHGEAVEAGVPPALVLAIINVESDFKRWAVSTTGAQGLMQIMPFWLKVAGQPGDNLFNPRTNVRLGCTILAYYLKQADGDITLALQSYYGRRYGTTYSDKVIRLLNSRWHWEH